MEKKKNPNVMERQHLPPRHSLSQGHLSKTSSFYFYADFYQLSGIIPFPAFLASSLLGGCGESQDLQLHPKVLKEIFPPVSVFPEPEKTEIQVPWDFSKDFVDGEADLV